MRSFLRLALVTSAAAVAYTRNPMKLNGPWYNDPIPESIFTDPHMGSNLNQHWVRKK